MAPSCTDAVMVLPAFWEELHLVASPELLARLGRALAGLAEGDADFKAAARLAAVGAQRRNRRSSTEGSEAANSEATASTPAASTRAWQAARDEEELRRPLSRGALGEPRPPSRLYSYNSGLLDVYPNFGVDLDDIDEGFDASDSSDGDAAEDSGSDAFRGIFPCTPLVELLPGLGTAKAQKFWLAVLSVSVLVQFGMACLPSEYVPLVKARSMPTETAYRVNRIIDALDLFVCIHILQGIRKFTCNKRMQAMLRERLQPSQRAQLQEFLRTVTKVLASVCLFAALERCWFIACEDRPQSVWALADIWGDGLVLVHTAVFVMVFFMLWRITHQCLGTISEQLDLHVHEQDWKHLMQQYNKFCQMLPDLWTDSFGKATICFLGVKLVEMTWQLVVAYQSESLTVCVHNFVYVTVDAVLDGGAVYLMGSIASKMVSASSSKKSVRYLAAMRYGLLPADQQGDHHFFVQSLLALPGGIEIRPVGVFTNTKAANLVRAMFALVPIGFSWAMKYV